MGLKVRVGGAHRIDPRVYPTLRQTVGGAERHVGGKDRYDLERVRVRVWVWVGGELA